MCWSTPRKHLLVQLESLINFTSYLFYFSWKPEVQVKPPLPSSSSREETIRSSSIQCWVGLVITEQEKYQMGLLRNNFISSCTLRKLSLIPSSLLDPRRLEYFTPTIPYLPHSTHRDNHGNASLFPTVKLTAKFTRSWYSKSILSREDGTNRINCVNNQVYVHTEDVEMHLR